MSAAELPSAASLTREAIEAKLLLPCTDGCEPGPGQFKPDHCFLCDGHHPNAASTRPEDHDVWQKVLDVDAELKRRRAAAGNTGPGECSKCGQQAAPGQAWCRDCKNRSKRAARAEEASAVESTTGLLPLEAADVDAGYQALLEKYGPRMDRMAAQHPPEVLAALPPAEVVLAPRLEAPKRRRKA